MKNAQTLTACYFCDSYYFDVLNFLNSVPIRFYGTFCDFFKVVHKFCQSFVNLKFFQSCAQLATPPYKYFFQKLSAMKIDLSAGHVLATFQYGKKPYLTRVKSSMVLNTRFPSTVKILMLRFVLQ